jgi:ribosome maturation factor RimP
LNDLVARTPMDRRLAGLLTPVIESMGYRLVRLRLQGGRSPILQIMAERISDGLMEVEDCATLSRAISAHLDVEDPIEGAYSLEVSSPGIDRPLTTPGDFERWAGWEAKLELSESVDGRKRFRGILQGFEDGEVLVEIAEGIIGLSFDMLGDARLVLTDALIAESLKGKPEGFDPGDFDEIEDAGTDDETDEDGTGGPKDRPDGAARREDA